jgi:predicted permease
VHLIGRLKPGVAASAAEAELNALYRRYLDEEPPLQREREARAQAGLTLEPGAGGASPLRQTFRGPLLALMAGVVVLLLIVCLNVSHLVLARAAGRRREVSIRVALGASRGRIARQLFAESLLLTVLSLGAAVLAVPWLKEALLSLSPPGTAIDTTLDLRVVLFTAGLTVAVTLVLGTVPAWWAARPPLERSLRGSAAAVTGGARTVTRVLLVSQVAFSLVLLVGAALLTGTLQKLRAVDKGFVEEGLALGGLELAPGTDRGGAEELQAQILARVRALPGVRSASLSHLQGLLGGGRITEVIAVPGKPTPTVDPTLVQLVMVGPGYLETVGMTIVRGRAIRREDGPGAPQVAVVNETMARHFFDGPDRAVGQRFGFDPTYSPSQKAAQIEVVGVVRDARINDLRSPPPPVAYLSVPEPDRILGNLQVRTTGDPEALFETLRRAVREARPGLSLVGLRTVRSQVERSLARERLLVVLSTAFGLAALFLVSLGLYGVISQWAGQRTRELGVRMALGATAGGVRWLVLRQALSLLAVGLAAGLPASLAASHLLESLLYGLTPTEPAIVGAAALVLLAAVVLAADFPARRAARIDPMAALRSE